MAIRLTPDVALNLPLAVWSTGLKPKKGCIVPTGYNTTNYTEDLDVETVDNHALAPVPLHDPGDFRRTPVIN